MKIERPLRHFTPAQGWMNDPNGLVWFEGEYHLFYQYHPDATIWGPMHWGHAVSTDLRTWTHLPIALAPDEGGTIFSGSVVVDHANTAGFARDGETALVAIYTLHDPPGKQARNGRHESQCIAYSVDRGRNWTKFSGNPVLPNPGAAPDFRDPKVFWHEATQQWIMSLAIADEIAFYASPDLMFWRERSRFGKTLGEHDGVWECPDLFEVHCEETGEAHWVLFVSLNPGGLQGGSGTQYFYGDFDGVAFRASQMCLDQIAAEGPLWLDFGPDYYAAVTFSNRPECRPRPVMMAWMNNWRYGQNVPENGWRGAMASPRELSLKRTASGYRLASHVVTSLAAPVTRAAATGLELRLDHPCADISLSVSLQAPDGGFRLTFSGPGAASASFAYEDGQFTAERALPAGVRIEDFARAFRAPRLSASHTLPVSLHLDHGSVEIIADHGLTPMTLTLFPGAVFDRVELSVTGAAVNEFSVASEAPQTIEQTVDALRAVPASR